MGAKSLAECVCEAGFYALTPSRCVPCPIGTSCPEELLGITIATLPIKPGFYRPSGTSIDVRRCPDAGTVCSETNASAVCAGAALSGCQGGRDPANLCRDGLAGVYCTLCVNGTAGNLYYAKAEGDEPARCEPCRDTAAVTAGAAAGVVVGLVLLLTLLVKVQPHCTATLQPPCNHPVTTS